jgi:hypothetical protein
MFADWPSLIVSSSGVKVKSRKDLHYLVVVDTIFDMRTPKKPRTGRKSLFPGKRRGRTISITMTDAHYRRLEQTMQRLNLTRADVLALLVDRFADIVEIPPKLAERLPAHRD